VIPLYRTVIRPVLFARESEAVHDSTLRVLGRAARNPVVCEFLASIFSPPALPIEVFGLRFPNPLGLAAGMDKQAAAVPAWKALGFGFCELGGVTWHAQDGNPRPRMFRAVHDEALVNRMGFNNPGAEALARKLAEWRALGRWPNHPVGINLGKSKITPLDKAPDDYAQSFRVLRPHADFFVVNVSSPNTPGLRQLQDKAALDEILAALQELNTGSQGRANRPDEPSAPKPILVKVAPDLEFSALDQILELVGARAVAGLIATNTTTARPSTHIPDLKQTYAEQGGLSGRPLRERSTEIIRHLYRQTRGTLPIIGVGGVFDADDAWQKISAGASLVQVYTGLVYQGPGITRAIVSGLRTKLAEAGLQSLRQAVGIATISP
jgi:dihydroorotate dehydrogenase